MTTAGDILQFMEALAPRALKKDYDNVGLLCGSKDKEVRTVLVALDPFPSVCREAAVLGADLLLTHHPLLFEASKITDESLVGRAVMELVRHDITAINAHTNLDCAEGGVNDTLAELLGMAEVSTLPADPHGLLRQGVVAKQELAAFLETVKAALHTPVLRYTDCGKRVARVAVGGGSCGSELLSVIAAGCDTFVTADVKYNQFWDAQELGVNIIDAGHFHTENPVMYRVAEKLRAAFPALKVIVSETHTDCVHFY